MARGDLNTFNAMLVCDNAGVLCVDGFGFVVQANPYLLEALGFSEADLLDKPVRVLFPDILEMVSGEGFGELMSEVLARTDNQILEAISVDGRGVKFEVTLFQGADKSDHVVLYCRDATELMQAKTRAHDQQEVLNAVLGQVADGILHFDLRGYLVDANPVAVEMLVMGNRRYKNLYVDDILYLFDGEHNRIYPFTEVINRERTTNLVKGIELHPPGGSGIPVMVSATPVRESGGRVNGCVIVIRAISESRRISTKLSWQETHDPLTQLANRRQVETEVVRAIEIARNENCSHGLIYIDLYNFSMINDTSGHAAGDELLRQFAQMLSREVGDFDVVGRTGNDEFSVLLWQRSHDEVEKESERLLRVASDFGLTWNNRRLKVGVSMGVEMITRDTSSEVDVMLAARAACAIARDNGRNRIHFPNVDKSVKNRYSLSKWATSIGEALDEDRFVVYCQPIHPLQQSQTVKHYEALVRMLDREGNIVAPGNFIPAAESSGFIDDIDKWVFEKILSTLASLPAHKRNQLAFAVNLSGYTISDEKFLDHVISRLKAMPLPEGCLQFEITETAAVKHFDKAAHFISSLQQYGCRFALDDFGSGLSSFGYLKQLPVNYLKIDGSFVRHMESEDVEYSMVSTINHLAHIMGLQTIAECIENQSQMQMLKDMGVDYGQGYYLAPPEPLENLIS
jgi:diguanylate cyclase (GGDEF) domain